MNEKIKVIDDGNWEEEWAEWFSCPKCEAGGLREGDNFCGNCGIALDWSDVTRARECYICEACKTILRDDDVADGAPNHQGEPPFPLWHWSPMLDEHPCGPVYKRETIQTTV